ncbi:MAG TPA: tRNA (adenosine(37)-N6)-threonylcarbamoyltransferase complex transferase subunit TsaD [Candidatus Dormibacteraeota bacterium]|nr:tRNA (adenosine(37)-N6)-threonylcarbamoyltransferase complex transferase subunit TsaD [Candidatus Dormibacteraeota bacterium]
MRLLALETTCDETAAAVVRDDFTVESSVIASQAAAHAAFGGVVPELAARMHLERLPSVVAESVEPIGGLGKSLDGVAVAFGPGLVGCLAVGVTYAQSLAAGLGLPVVGVSHMSGHVLAARIEDPTLEPPFVALVVSGGHTDLIHYQAHDRVVLMGATRDDAVGEAFDKVARMLGLPYPGGPAIDRLAATGDASKYRLPRPVLPDFEFSFSGLKTAVLYLIRDLGELSQEQVADLAASFRLAAVETLCIQLEAAVEQTASTRVVLAGGVARNQLLRQLVRERLQGIATVTIPAPDLCTDNAAMIGAAAWTKVARAGFDPEPFGVEPGLRAYV